MENRMIMFVWLGLLCIFIACMMMWHVLRAPRKTLYQHGYNDVQINRIRRNFPRNWIREDERDLDYSQTWR